ncbi:vacuole membrane protein KMS1-like isoform X2 [Phoenix dactylifera]|uniref:Vacuole membrane protein KMS1-like isoform X2 n=1 Tax=Phoenix dactylifera TaxID=42345 RepID=A0A8B7CQN5_PHODC|nr:vacuole membrane protein KMS1-like isoform X2 [Phoenix dactylifera]
MGSRGAAVAASPSLSEGADPLISELHKKHRLELEKLTLITQPFRTLTFFFFATVQNLKKLLLYILRKGGWFKVLSILVVAFGLLLMAVDGSHEKHVQEFLCYSRFGLWWVALGVASSIGLGSGLHTFVLYLGPHIALFTIKAMQCGRVDLKTAPYDTIQLKKEPSWLEKDCLEFGPPLYPSSPSSLVRVSVSRILPQVQLEAVLWGIGTALGELPPYFISRAAHLSASNLETMEDLGAASSNGDGFISASLKKIKCWLVSRLQHLNFFTILVLASVPNPLFDLAGIICGQFGIPFWKFFLATLTGKAIIKAYMQTVFIISICNNQLLELVEDKLIWVFGPGFSGVLPDVIAKLHMVKDKYLSAPVPAPDPSAVKGKQWNLTFTTIWNTFIWLMLMNFTVKIVQSTAQKYLERQQDLELTDKLSRSRQSSSD